MKTQKSHLRSVFLFSLLSLPPLVYGQEKDTAVISGSLENVTVVGSRNPKRSATESPVPVDVIPLKQVINQVGQLDLTQLLTFLAPSFNSVRQTLGDGTDHVDPAQLRGLGPDQVLVLVDGKRYHQSSLVNVNGTVNRGTTGTDLNSIPASSIDRIEILRDGAAAQYGSDAIAGVINIVLKKQKGLTFTSSYGANVTQYDKNYTWNRLNPNSQLPGHMNITDGYNEQFALNYGFTLPKGYLNITGEYLHRGSSNRTGLYTGQIWPSVNGVDRSDSINKDKGLTRDAFDIQAGNAEVKGGGWVVNFGYPISDRLEVYATAIGNYRNGYAHGLYRYPYTLLSGATSSSFPVSTAYPDVYDGAAASAKVQALYPNGYLPEINSKVRDYSFTAGIRGEIGTWKAYLSQTYGSNSYEFLVGNAVNNTQAYLGNVASSDLVTSFNSGKTKLYQAVTNLDFSKNHDILQGLNTAVGAEFRVDGYGIDAGEYISYANLTSDNNLSSIAGSQAFGGFTPGSAGSWSRKSFALYTDNELQITKQWLLTGALRYEHFSDFGSTLNYKFSTLYKITPALSIRGAASSGFRAPSLAQIHYAKVTTQFVTVGSELVPVQAGTFPNDSKVAELLGIPQLKQETSHSYSAGFTYKILSGLDLTVDAYQIDIKNRIVLSNNFTGGTDATLTQELNAAGAGTAALFANAIDTRSRGIEGVLNYTTSWGGNQRLILSYAHSTIVNRAKKDKDGKVIIHSSSVLENSGQVGNYFTRVDLGRLEDYSPKNKDIASANYFIGKFNALVRFSYFGEVSYLGTSADPVANTFTGTVETVDQTFKGKGLTDISIGYKLAKIVTLTVGSNNLFDVYPDKQTHYNNTSTGRFTYSRAVSQFGYNGRYVFGKITVNL